MLISCSTLFSLHRHCI